MLTKTINIKLQKKWLDFVNPKAIEHYGYSFTESDLRQFPEGRFILCRIRREKRHAQHFKRNFPLILALADQFNKTMDDLVRQVITEPKCQLRP